MAAAATQAQLCPATDTEIGGGSSSSGASASDSDALAVAAAVSLCVLHDLVGAALFLASHPLHAVYLFIFARGLLTVAAFFWPLLASTALLLAVLGTVGPYIAGGGADWPGVRSLGRTCGIAVAALCAGLRPDVAGAGLVGQLCSFVLGPGDAASVLRVGEIMGEPCDITACCLVLEEEKSLFLLGGGECKELAFEELPVVGGDSIGERSFLDYEDFGDLKDEVDEKVVISEDLKGSDSLAVQCGSRDTLIVHEMKAEEEEEGNSIQGKGLILSVIDEVSDGVEEKRLECDPVSVEIKKYEPVQALEIKKLEPVEPMEAKKLGIKESEEIRKCEQVQAVKVKKSEPVESVATGNAKPVQEMEVKKFEQVKQQEIRKSDPVEPVEIKKRDPVKPRSSIAQRIKLWEAQVSGNVKPVLEDKDENSVELSMDKESIKDVEKCVPFEADICLDKRNSEQQAQEVAPNEESTNVLQEQEFKDVKEYTTRPETETSSEKCSQNNEAEETALAVSQAAEEELEQGYCNGPHPEPELQEQVHEISEDLQEMEEVYTDVTSSPALWNGSPLKSTSIAGRVHSRTSSENLVGEGSPSRKDKEWKRTLACKLYEERMQLRLCRDRAVVEGSDNMDMLWEAYEVGSGGGGKGRGGKRSGSKAKGGVSSKVEELVDEGEEGEVEEDEEEEGSVRQLCCLQALKFSTRKMNFGGGKPSLSKISKVLRRMTALSRMGSRRKQSG